MPSACAPAAAEPRLSSPAPVAGAEFAALMAELGPFEPSPRLGVGVSGGADSLALALLAQDWARARGGGVLGLIVDHGLRPAAAAEARLTAGRLAARQIGARILPVADLCRGSALAARARQARHAALEQACSEAGIVHLLLGHHARDQAETLMIRVLSGSFDAGLAGMAALAERAGVRVLRPLLGVAPERLRATLAQAGIGWIEDPSNADPAAQRGRLRQAAALDGAQTAALCAAGRRAGLARAERERRIAAVLAERATLHEAGFARLSPGPIEPAALAALLRTIGGAQHAPPAAAVGRLAARPRAATLGGVRLLPAGRLGDGWPGDGWLLVREAAAMAPSVPAVPGAVWDGRFRLAAGAAPAEGAALGALGAEAAALRDRTSWPAAVLRSLPALRQRGALIAVPHLDFPDQAVCARLPVWFAPPLPAAGAPFLPA